MKPKWTRTFDMPPFPPNQLYGTLFTNGVPTPGVIIQACIPDIPNVGNYFCRGEALTNSEGKFTLMFPSEGLHSSEIGKTATFWVNDIQCAETFVLQSGYMGTMNLNLSGNPAPNSLTQMLADARDAAHFTADWAGILEANLQTLMESGIGGETSEPIPFYISGKRGSYSRLYLSEFITPQNLMVRETASFIQDKTGDELIRAAYDIIAPVRYQDDDRVWNCADWWQLPHETLNRQAGDCEDTSFLLTSLLIATGLSRDKVRCAIGVVTLNGIQYGHAWVEVKRTDDQWWWLETTWDEWRDWALVPGTFTRQLVFTDKTFEEF